MGGQPRRARLARPAVLALLTAAVWLAAAQPAGAARWSAPFRVGGPAPRDVLPPQIAFSPTGDAAIGYGLYDIDAPAQARAYVVVRSADGSLSRPRQVPAASQVLDLAFDGSALDLLSGVTAGTRTCCSAVDAVRLAGARFTRQTLVRNLTSAAQGMLLPLANGRWLASVAGGQGVWAAQSRPDGRFGRAGKLTTASQAPQLLAGATLPSGTATVAWAAAPAPPPQTAARTIYVARETSGARSPRARRAVTVAPAHEVDELGVAPRPAGATLAWIESWYDSQGAFHSAPFIADVGRTVRPKMFRVGAAAASGLSFAGDPAGDQVIAWNACQTSGSCHVYAAFRVRGRRFGRPLAVGSADASQEPVAAISKGGEVLIGWINRGHALAAAHLAGAARLMRPHTLSSGPSASDLTIAFGPAGDALAAWAEGTAQSTVTAAIYR